MNQIKVKFRTPLLGVILARSVRFGHLSIIPVSEFFHLKEETDPELSGHEKNIGALENLEKYW